MDNVLWLWSINIHMCIQWILIFYTSYLTVNFWGEKFILLWLILLTLSVSSLVFGVVSAMDSCKLSPDNFILYIDSGSKVYQWVYHIYLPDISLLPWIFILGFTSMRYFFIKWKLVRLFFVFLSYNAFFIGIGIFIIGYYILEQNEEYELIWQVAIGIISVGFIPCFIFIIYTILCVNHHQKEHQTKKTTSNINYEEDEHENDEEYVFNPHQSFTIWVAIQMITSFLDLWSDILYVFLSDFYSPYLKIACWGIYIFPTHSRFLFITNYIKVDRYNNNNNKNNNNKSNKIIEIKLWFQ